MLKRCPAMAAFFILSAAACFPVEGCSEEKDLTPIGLLEYRLEIERHQKLQQAIAGTEQLTEFTTDGCSGGLSVGWEYLAARIPRFRALHGETPPWQECCVAHDREYHSGGGGMDAEGSFFLRIGADQRLRECVRSTGSDRADELSRAYGLSAQEVEGLYLVISHLMYRAVRIGGIPCSGLPWRWGYGWPGCAF